MVVLKKTLEAQSIEDCGRRGAIRISRILSHAIDAPAGQSAGTRSALTSANMVW